VKAIGEMRFSRDHIWVRMDDDNQATIGLTDYLQEKMGEMKAPVSGEVVEINYEAMEVPEIVNEDPLSEGWLVKVEMTSGLEFDELFTEEEYADHLSEEEDLEED
jgi:glycine cleavage system H protein